MPWWATDGPEALSWTRVPCDLPCICLYPCGSMRAIVCEFHGREVSRSAGCNFMPGVNMCVKESQCSFPIGALIVFRSSRCLARLFLSQPEKMSHNFLLSSRLCLCLGLLKSGLIDQNVNGDSSTSESHDCVSRKLNKTHIMICLR